MRVRHRMPQLEALPLPERRYVTPKQVFLSTATEYEVHAVSVYDGVVFLQVVDDLRSAEFLPRSLFEVVDHSIPEDWICNVFPDGPVQSVIGPEFVARDVHAYDGMIDQRSEQFDQFWRRVRAREVAETPEADNG